MTGSLYVKPTHAPAAQTLGHITIVTPDIVGPVKNGGIGTACFHYARSLAGAGYAVDVLFSEAIGEEARRRWSNWYDDFGIRFHTLDEVPASRVKGFGSRPHVERAHQIFTYLRRQPCDYVIFQDWKANGFWATRAKQMGVAFSDIPIGLITHSPHQWQKEGMSSFGRPLDDSSLEWAEKETIAAVDILISPSYHMLDWLQSRGYRLPDRVVICPYTFEDQTIAAAPAAVDASHVIFFGRLETRKGLHLLGGALRELRQRNSPLPQKVSFLGKLAEVNGVSATEYLERLQADLRDVEFVVEPDLDYIQAVDYIRAHNGLVVIPSILDNHPLTVIESIGYRFCFVASDAGGIPEMIDPAVCFEPTAAGLRQKLEELHTIDFSALEHPYDSCRARRVWLDHVQSVVDERRKPRSARQKPGIEPVSVCIPFYRHDRYIDRVVSAFLRMNLPDLQLVLVNDGTPLAERTRYETIRRTLEPLGHIFHDQPNSGPGVARNKAVELARHDRLLFFDSDNVPFPDMVERLSRAMSSASADSIAVPYIGVPPMIRRPLLEDTVSRYLPQGGPMAVALVENVVGDVCSLVRREVVEAVGGFSHDRHQHWEDWDFFLRVVGHGFHHLVYPEPLFFYTVDQGGRCLSAVVRHCQAGLIRSLRTLPPAVGGEIAEIFAQEYLVHGRR